jgi:hypothetical protein
VTAPADGLVSRALLADRSLVLHADPQCWPVVRPWVPLNSLPADGAAAPSGVIAVASGESMPPPEAAEPPTLQVGPARAWLGGASGVMTGASATWGALDLAKLRASVWADVAAGERAAADLYPMLTIAAALLLARMGHALIHAGAVVAPDGRAWLVVGDARSGKSTACVSLAKAGWGLLSDDQVVLAPTARGVSVEGWLRPVHLDEGWSECVPRGRRRTIDLAEIGGGAPGSTAMLAGTLHTSVDSGARSQAREIATAEAFTGVVRQSPWLLADRAVAPSLVGLLSDVARLPRVALQLGLETFGKPECVAALLTPVVP